MKLFVDEDTGSSVAKALEAVGVQVEYVSNSKHRRIRTGTPDEEWLRFAGSDGRLVLSRNLNIMRTEAQLQLVISERVGIVFLPQHISRFELLRLVMKKWDWLENVDTTEARPFAFRMGPMGRATRLPLNSATQNP